MLWQHRVPERWRNGGESGRVTFNLGVLLGKSHVAGKPLILRQCFIVAVRLPLANVVMKRLDGGHERRALPGRNGRGRRWAHIWRGTGIRYGLDVWSGGESCARQPERGVRSALRVR